MIAGSKVAYSKPTSRGRTAIRAVEKETDMKRPATEYVSLVEVMELTVPFEEFEDAIRATTKRLEDKGVRELVSMNFYAEPGSTRVGAILTFSDRERMTEHVALVSSWPEFERFFATVKPLDVRVYGRLSAEAEAWICRLGDIVSRKFEDHVAGFVR
jgi:hypothetical protein